MTTILQAADIEGPYRYELTRTWEAAMAVTPEQRDAAVRWLAFAGLDFSTDDWSSVVAAFERRGLSWFVDSLAKLEPVVIGSRHFLMRWEPLYDAALNQTERVLVMQQAISSVLACLRHAYFRLGSGELVTDPSLVADLLIERGHSWLGESLAIWLRGDEGDHDLAVRLLVERMPVLPEFAEWKRIDDAAREAEGTSISFVVDGVTQTAFIKNNSTSAEIAAAINAQIFGAAAGDRIDADV